MYNIENISIPIISPLLSILIFTGLHFLGFFLIHLFKLNKIISEQSNLNYQSSLIGIIFITFLIFPFVVLNLFNLFLIKLLSYILIFFGVLFTLKKLNFKNKIKFKYDLKVILIFAVIFSYFLISLGPITNADSLDYHIGVPLFILNHEFYPNYKFWMHLPTSGAGEIFYTIGLINHAEQLPGLTQISAILSIVGVILKKIKSQKSYENHYLVLIFISCPVLIFFVSSAKVQLLYVAASALTFALLFFNKTHRFNNLNFLILLNIFFSTAMAAKFSFTLSSGLLWLYTLFFCYKNNYTKKFLIISFLIFGYILIPKIIYKIQLYDLNLIEALIYPLPRNLYGYEQLYQSLTSCGYNGCFPYWLIFPKNINTITEALGVGSIILIFIKYRIDKKFIFVLCLILTQIIFSHIFGPNNARWYIEPFVWSIIAVKFFGFNNDKVKKIFFTLAFLQTIIIFVPIMYGVINLLPGSLSDKLNTKVMKNNADGYELFKWVNSNINENSVIISTHRSFSLNNSKTIPGDLFMYIDINNEKAQEYYEEIKEMKPNLILFYDDKKNFKKFEKCLGQLKFYGQNVGSKASRNPFNRVKERYDGFIYEFNHLKLPDCIIHN
jgi:hypothetical protein